MVGESLGPIEDWGAAPGSEANDASLVDWGESVPVGTPITIDFVPEEATEARDWYAPKWFRSNLSAIEGFIVHQCYKLLSKSFDWPSGMRFPIPGTLHRHEIGWPDLRTDKVSPPPTIPETSASPPTPRSEQRISIWLDGQSSDAPPLLQVGESYTLNFKVGSAVAVSLVRGELTFIPKEDLPEDGLLTEWEVVTADAELSAPSEEVRVEKKVLNGQDLWVARFSLLVHPVGESDIRRIGLVPLSRPSPRIDVIIYRGKEVYRELTLQLPVSIDAPAIEPILPLEPVEEVVHAPLTQTALKPAHEWTTPPGKLTVTVTGDRASVFGDGTEPGMTDPWDIVPWNVTQAEIDGIVMNVRKAADKLRGKWDKYLNAIDPDDLTDRLRNWTPQYNWGSIEGLCDDIHKDMWAQVEVSDELFELAYHGRYLFDVIFREDDSQLHEWITSLAKGTRLNLMWTQRTGQAFWPHVPWGLMYLHKLPKRGSPIDPMGFLGLRFRIGYMKHAGKPKGKRFSKALGGFADTHKVHFLYWGNDPNDPVAKEAKQQRRDWHAWPKQVFVPGDPSATTTEARAAMLDQLLEPKPSPTSMLYIYCHCETGAGNDPGLVFGESATDEDRIDSADLARTTPLADRPFVFANACSTSASDTYIANMLEETFFHRECRGFLGSETKVPIAFASRFASIFFHFFYPAGQGVAIPAGEAVAQTRLFLWNNYRNIGGLLYTYINEYELFMADEQNLPGLRQ
ncbi:hypothetical protein BB934_45785 (plasmid) [Microvirga ossetica]|uniref:CHAT domain-containing protein n=1 Tax=Microvirga ossetica TaxID=1882682 RepID=A0A1B2F063_9HYPH|nr:hypothetical protein [Microvirga ossetica]ANY85533.1 hypothetical protein BB934_45785 [Microvirga ossetica]